MLTPITLVVQKRVVLGFLLSSTLFAPSFFVLVRSAALTESASAVGVFGLVEQRDFLLILAVCGEVRALADHQMLLLLTWVQTLRCGQVPRFSVEVEEPFVVRHANYRTHTLRVVKSALCVFEMATPSPFVDWETERARLL